MGSLDLTPLNDLSKKENGVVTSVGFTNADSSPKTVWASSGGKNIFVDDIFIYCNNKHASNFVTFKLEVRKSGTWYELLGLVIYPQEGKTLTHSFGGNMRCKDIRVKKAGNSDNFNGNISILGREK